MSMNTITVTLSEARLAKLRAIAERYQISPEELVRAGIEDLLSRPDADFQDALEYILDKNSELYRRLA